LLTFAAAGQIPVVPTVTRADAACFCRSASRGKASGSFLKKRTEKLLQIQAEPLRKGRSQFSKSFLLLFFNTEDACSLLKKTTKRRY
jgi:hypothetical protein